MSRVYTGGMRTPSASALRGLVPAGLALLAACGPVFPRPTLHPEAVIGDLAGVKVLSGHPEGGLPFRLRLPADASPERPARLVIWLHPTGTSANAWVEALSPDLARRGFALLVFTHAQEGGWSGAEANQLMGVTLPAVARLPGVDARRPVLMGFSAGGQLALLLWKQTPGRFGALVVSGAAPFDVRGGEFVPLQPPGDPAIRDVPLYVLAGERDEASRVWRERQEDFRKGGVTLQLRVVPGAGHQFLFLGDELPPLYQFLENSR